MGGGGLSVNNQLGASEVAPLSEAEPGLHAPSLRRPDWTEGGGWVAPLDLSILLPFIFGENGWGKKGSNGERAHRMQS